MTLGEKIKFLREKKNLSQQDLADALNTSKQNIYKYEKGKITNIPLDKIPILARTLSTTPAYLMGWDEDSVILEEPSPTVYVDSDKKIQAYISKLFNLRKKADVTQKAMADYLGVSRQAYANYENGIREPDIKALKKLSKYFNVSVDYIIDNDVFDTPNTEIVSLSNKPFVAGETLTEQENALLAAFRGTTEEGRMKIIQAVYNVCDEIERREINGNNSHVAG